MLSEIKADIDTCPKSAADKALAVRHIRIIEQLAEALQRSYTFLGWEKARDRSMAENAEWIKRYWPESKLILWAHNGHIQNKDFRMGAHLKKTFGADYAPIGFVLGEGTYTARRTDGDRSISSDNVLTVPKPGSCEYVLSLLDEEIFLLDLKRLKEENQGDMDWFLGNFDFREIGAEAKEFIHRNEPIAERYDYLIFIRNSTASRMIPKAK